MQGGGQYSPTNLLGARLVGNFPLHHIMQKRQKGARSTPKPRAILSQYIAYPKTMYIFYGMNFASCCKIFFEKP